MRRSHEQRVAPGSETLRALFGDAPVLIPLDELSVGVPHVAVQGGRIDAGPGPRLHTRHRQRLPRHRRLLGREPVRRRPDGRASLHDRPAAPLRFLAEANLSVVIRARSSTSTRLKPAPAQTTASGTSSTARRSRPSRSRRPVRRARRDRRRSAEARRVRYDGLAVGGTVDEVPELIERMFANKGADGSALRVLRNHLVFVAADEHAADGMRRHMRSPPPANRHPSPSNRPRSRTTASHAGPRPPTPPSRPARRRQSVSPCAGDSTPQAPPRPRTSPPRSTRCTCSTPQAAALPPRGGAAPAAPTFGVYSPSTDP